MDIKEDIKQLFQIFVTEPSGDDSEFRAFLIDLGFIGTQADLLSLVVPRRRFDFDVGTKWRLCELFSPAEIMTAFEDAQCSRNEIPLGCFLNGDWILLRFAINSVRNKFCQRTKWQRGEAGVWKWIEDYSQFLSNVYHGQLSSWMFFRPYSEDRVRAFLAEWRPA